MKTYENVKCDVNVRIMINKPRLFHVWLFGVDLTMCKFNKRLIIFVMQSNIASKHATWMARYTMVVTGPRSAVGNVSDYRYVSDCRSRGGEFDPGPVPYFRGDWSWNNFYSHSPPFRWFIQEGLLSVISESMCTNYWLTACSSLPRKKCG